MSMGHRKAKRDFSHSQPDLSTYPKMPFQEEFLALLKRQRVEYDPRSQTE